MKQLQVGRGGLFLLALALGWVAGVVVAEGDAPAPRGEVVATVWRRMAVVQTKQANPPPAITHRFHTALDQLVRHCPDTQARLGDMLLAGQRELAQRGGTTTLLGLTETTAKALDVGEVDSPRSCSAVITLMVVTILDKQGAER